MMTSQYYSFEEAVRVCSTHPLNDGRVKGHTKLFRDIQKTDKKIPYHPKRHYAQLTSISEMLGMKKI